MVECLRVQPQKECSTARVSSHSDYSTGTDRRGEDSKLDFRTFSLRRLTRSKPLTVVILLLLGIRFWKRPINKLTGFDHDRLRDSGSLWIGMGTVRLHAYWTHTIHCKSRLRLEIHFRTRFCDFHCTGINPRLLEMQKDGEGFPSAAVRMRAFCRFWSY
ncbi:hypothetical protein Mp_3g21050 [Marchantia polymorpha subsp. ruderalis]|uniref:Uncharacterized protein n=2 Tax=Marchantia polymorpha TaxID=3197 RepID=A0AAF6B341_MARPO|nr:hypothetical protein MARPO_0160s0001 [Marchantia polymorpha]BBN06425.1 hypothetical protein Mp_3g21050 [Marchantia polymorpha subsp. ruderalis]|eukprot:PTQ28545.1 hypothetical protein MARPO_0160s0001 [Marchantia polymorpha]